MLDRMLQNDWCRFLAGNLSVALLVVGLPMAVLLQVTEVIASATAGVIALGIVHLALLGLQVSFTGAWIPEKWLAAGYIILPVVDVSKTVAWFSRGDWVQGFWAFVLAVVAAFVTVWIIKNEHRKWRTPKTAGPPTRPTRYEDPEIHYPMDDPTTLVY